MAQAIGMMEGAYFVGRVELLNWLNEFLQLDYKKVEQVCSGSAYCQLMDALNPGKVPLHKVNFNAKFDYEFIKNFAVLQEVFTKVGIEKKIEVPVLVKGKFQDNLEFLQWMKKYFDMHYGGDPYDAIGRRQTSGKGAVKGSSPAKKTTSNIKPSDKPVAKAPGTASKGTSLPIKAASPVGKSTKAPAVAAPVAPATQSGDKGQRVQQLELQVEELQTIAAEVEKERDFYFAKLRDIEVLCQSADQNELTEAIFNILSASDEPTEGQVDEVQSEEPPQEDEEDETF